MNLERITLQAGTSLEEAQAAVVLVHGRGGTAQGMLQMAGDLSDGDLFGIAWLAPQAPGNTWYPYSFLAPIRQNEPYLSQSLEQLGGLLSRIETAGLPFERVLLAGFSQGACLVSEFLARSASRFGGLIAFSGGLIGPAGTQRDYAGSLDGTPIFLGCSENDPHIPAWRVEETASVLRGLNGQVTARLYPDGNHTIRQDELEFARKMLREFYDSTRSR